tara:strand:- start:64917 stop:65738 length:822 start_codon:yes stop_codon:yes gene_type:complete
MASPKYGKIDYDYALQLATTTEDKDGPIWMVNLMSYHDIAQYGDGNKTKITGREADDLYSPLEPLKAIGAEPVYFGEVENKLLGDQRDWDRIAVVKYPTRKSFIEMQERKDFQAKHVHKEAGMKETIVMGCLPMDFPIPQSALPDWEEVEYPSSSKDGPIVALHVVKFRNRTELGETPEKMAEYTSKAATIGIKQGVRISGWFGVEGTIVGDGREWDQVRFNAFPSKAAFMAVIQDPERLEAQKAHREEAIIDTYTLIVRTKFDRIKESIEQQ